MKLYFTILLSLFISGLQGQAINTNWKKDLNASLQNFINCRNAGGEGEACNKFQCESLNTVYKVNDFYSSKSGRYMTVNEIAQFLKESKTWTSLGPVYDQEILNKAQSLANAKKAVVAIYQNAVGAGHLVLVIPGEVQQSGSWGLQVPNVASFFLPEPERSFVDKGLSYAFTKNMIRDIAIYVRNY